MRNKAALKTIVFALFIAAGLFFWHSCLAANIMVNSSAPFFKVVSGDNKEINLNSIKGKVAAVFYETRSTVERNRRLKTELNRFYAAQPDYAKALIMRIAVVNCAGVFFTGAWKNELKERSKKEGITIYGDWDGKMSASYGIKDKESNFIIIDKQGLIRHYSAGIAMDKDIGTIKDLLISLVNER